MTSVLKNLLALCVAILVLAGFFYVYGNKFNITLEMFRSEKACLAQLQNTEDNMIAEFRERALDAIGRKGYGEALPTATTFESWKPSFKSLQIFLDPDAIIDLAVSRVRSSIAKNQNEDPTSLLNTQIKLIQSFFDTAKGWCTHLS